MGGRVDEVGELGEGERRGSRDVKLSSEEEVRGD